MNEPFQPRRGFVSGRPVTIIGEWHDHPDYGYNYRYDGDRCEHWIRCGNPRLTSELPKANYPVPSVLLCA